VKLVDLATGVCTPQPALLQARNYFAAAALYALEVSKMWGPPVQGAEDAAWTWRALPAMNGLEVMAAADA